MASLFPKCMALPACDPVLRGWVCHQLSGCAVCHLGGMCLASQLAHFLLWHPWLQQHLREVCTPWSWARSRWERETRVQDRSVSLYRAINFSSRQPLSSQGGVPDERWVGLGEGGNPERWKTDSALWQAGCKDVLVYLIKVGEKHFCQTVCFVYEQCQSCTSSASLRWCNVYIFCSLLDGQCPKPFFLLQIYLNLLNS